MARQPFPALLTAAFLALCADPPAPSFAAGKRSAAAVRDFKRLNPCPATGITRGSCPGWIVDHVVPLCAGGADVPENMQWQTKEEATEKDREEWRLCRRLKRQRLRDCGVSAGEASPAGGDLPAPRPGDRTGRTPACAFARGAAPEKQDGARIGNENSALERRHQTHATSQAALLWLPVSGFDAPLPDS